MITLSQVQEKIIEAIKRSGITQTELAQKVGVTQSVISHYVNGRKLPALDTLANLCVVLDLDANDILCVR
ncbi:MAG: helix-turn-helix transcriptional regulator [Clostridia bacterium]|nr:helix-turn-helix transcriptional regulator [Clostridia bacterium]